MNWGIESSIPRPEGAIWWGGANYYLAVWGEYERSHGWSFDRDVCERFIRLHISITEKRSPSRRRRPTWWKASLSVNGSSIRLSDELGGQPTQGRCRSLKDARRQADLIPRDAIIAEAARQNWDLGRVECVYKMEDGKPVPFLTKASSTNLQDITSNRDQLIVLPSRNKRKHNMGRGWVVSGCWGGYTATGADKNMEMPKPWI